MAKTGTTTIPSRSWICRNRDDRQIVPQVGRPSGPRPFYMQFPSSSNSIKYFNDEVDKYIEGDHESRKQHYQIRLGTGYRI
jgi:hypothetical protein